MSPGNGSVARSPPPLQAPVGRVRSSVVAFFVIRCGPSHWRARAAPAALKKLAHLPEKPFSTHRPIRDICQLHTPRPSAAQQAGRSLRSCGLGRRLADLALLTFLARLGTGAPIRKRSETNRTRYRHRIGGRRPRGVPLVLTSGDAVGQMRWSHPKQRHRGRGSWVSLKSRLECNRLRWLELAPWVGIT